MVCENCQKLADDVDLWKTKYKEVKKTLELAGKIICGKYPEKIMLLTPYFSKEDFLKQEKQNDLQ